MIPQDCEIQAIQAGWQAKASKNGWSRGRWEGTAWNGPSQVLQAGHAQPERFPAHEDVSAEPGRSFTLAGALKRLDRACMGCKSKEYTLSAHGTPCEMAALNKYP